MKRRRETKLTRPKDLLSAVQEAVVDEQVNAAFAAFVACPGCGTPRRHKDARAIVVASLYGTLHLRSPRWWHCTCQDPGSYTFSPLAAMLPERPPPSCPSSPARH